MLPSGVATINSSPEVPIEDTAGGGQLSSRDGVARFPYLKKGSGLTRYGGVRPPTTMTSQPRRHSPSNTNHNPLAVRDDDGGDDSARLTTDSGCRDVNMPPAHDISASALTSPRTDQTLSSLSDTRHFEAVERLMNDSNFTFSSDDSLIGKVLTNYQRKTPRVRELTDDVDENVAPPHPPTSTQNDGVESGNISSLSSQRSFPQTAVKSVDHHDAQEAVNSHTVAPVPSHEKQTSSPLLVNPLERFHPRQPPTITSVDPVFTAPWMQPTFAPYAPTSLSAHQPTVETALATKLRAMIDRMDRDYALFVDRERVLERKEAELNQLRVVERDRLAKESVDMKREIEQFRDEEIVKIKHLREQALRQKSAVDKKETEQVKLLRERISDLENDVFERDAKLSSMRAELRQGRLDLERSAKQLAEKTAEAERLTGRNRSLESQVNVLRTRAARLANAAKTTPDKPSHAAVSNAKMSAADRISKSAPPPLPSKRVTFQLPSQETPVSASVVPSMKPSSSSPLLFARTDNHGTQTSFLQHNHGSTPLSSRRPLVSIQPPPSTAAAAEHISDPVATVLSDQRLANGNRTLVYSDNLVQDIYADGSQRFSYANGDWRKVAVDGTQTYHYAANGCVEITKPDGTVIVRFNDGRTDTHHADGTVDVVLTDGRQAHRSADGKKVEGTLQNGVRFVQQLDHVLLRMPDGSCEYRYADKTQKVFPSGDTITLYNDGTKETKLTNGRIRIKDPSGTVIRDEMVA